MAQLQAHQIEPIDLVISNLYPFEMVRAGAVPASSPRPLPFNHHSALHADRGFWQRL